MWSAGQRRKLPIAGQTDVPPGGGRNPLPARGSSAGILSGGTAAAHLDSAGVIFKQVGEGRPYPDHARSSREWAAIPPRPVRLDQLITTKDVLDLHTVLAKDSTFYGDLFPHVIRWKGELYLEDGLHRALRAALHQRTVLHVRVLELD
jgi:Arc/MetJ family transcription regulator